MLALAGGLWVAGCATTEDEDTGEPGIAYTVGSALGQVFAGFFTGFFAGWAGQPQNQAGGVYQSPTYNTGAYVQSYGRPAQARPVHHRPHRPDRHAPHHHGHRPRR